MESIETSDKKANAKGAWPHLTRKVMECIETSDKKANAKGAWPHLTLHQTAMFMLFVCCGCAPFETVTDEQFASQMVEFKQETLDYTYYVGSSDADDYFIHRGRWNDRKYKLKRNVLLFDFERIDLTHEERKWIRIGLSRRANCYVVKKWELIGFDDIWLLCDGVAPLNKSH